jgi:uncharacterized protein YecT (DUF1311 family)
MSVLFFLGACDRSGDPVKSPKYYSYDGVEGKGDLRAVDFSDKMNMFIDTKSFRREGDSVSFWVVSNFKGETLEQMKSQHNVSSTRVWDTINCHEKTLNFTQIIGFSEPWLGGREVSRAVGNEGVTAIEKESVSEVKMRIACSYPQSQTSKAATSQEASPPSALPVVPAPASVEVPTPTTTSTSPTMAPSPAPTSAPPTAPPTTPTPVPALNAQSAPMPALPPVVDSSPYAPSFDCSKASATHEKLICGDRELSRLDVDLSQAYSTARDKSADKEKLKKEQLEWIKASLRSCADKSCLVGAYQKRILDLK